MYQEEGTEEQKVKRNKKFFGGFIFIRLIKYKNFVSFDRLFLCTLF